MIKYSPLIIEALNALNEKRKKPVGYTPQKGEDIDLNTKSIAALNKLAEQAPGGLDAKFTPHRLRKYLQNQAIEDAKIDLYLGKIGEKTPINEVPELVLRDVITKIEDSMKLSDGVEQEV